MPAARPLDALLISDSKPGHYHQAEGVLAAIAKIRPVNTHRLEVRRRRVIPSRMLQQLINTGTSPATILRLGYGIRARALPPMGIVVSAGGETLAANAAAAKLFGVPNVFCGRLRRLAPDHVRLVIVQLERFATHPNFLVVLPPSPMDPARPAPSKAQRARTGPPDLVGVLVGGNSGALTFTGEDWNRLTGFLREAHAAYGVRWLVTTSRRSDAVIGDALVAAASDPASGIERFIDYRTAGPGTLDDIFAAADAILVTDDSTTMISEVVSARLPVVAVTPSAGQHEDREAEYRSLLARRGWYRAVPLSQLTPEGFLAALAQVTPRSGNALDELAARLEQRLPEVFA